jgi:MFS family permease
MFVRTPAQFYTMRVLLGFAEAGFFPGIIYYLSHWFPAEQRARAISWFMIAVPLGETIGNPLSGFLLGLDGRLGLHGWQWLFLIEGIPSVVLGIVAIGYLTDRIEDAAWLSAAQRSWLAARIRSEDVVSEMHTRSVARALLHPMVWLLALPYLLTQAPSYGYAFFGPTIIRDTLGSSDAITGLVSGLIALLAATTMLVFGSSSDRTGERCLHAALGTLIAVIGWVGLALLANPLARVAALALAWMGLRAYIVPFWCMPNVLLRGTGAAAGIALINSIGNVGGFAGTYLLGYLSDTPTLAFLLLATMTAVGGSIFLVLRRHPSFAISRETGGLEPSIEAVATS